MILKILICDLGMEKQWEKHFLKYNTWNENNYEINETQKEEINILLINNYQSEKTSLLKEEKENCRNDKILQNIFFEFNSFKKMNNIKDYK